MSFLSNQPQPTNKFQEFIVALKQWNQWNLQGYKQYENAMTKLAKKIGFVEVDSINIKPYKGLINTALYEYHNGKLYDELHKLIWRDISKMVNEDSNVVIFQPRGKTSFPDFIIMNKGCMRYVECKIYNKGGKKPYLGLGETQERPLGIYVTFDQGAQIVNVFYGAHLNKHGEEEKHMIDEIKKKMKILNKELREASYVGMYASKVRLIRDNVGKFVPHQHQMIEVWEDFVFETINKPTLNFIKELHTTEEYFGGFKQFME